MLKDHRSKDDEDQFLVVYAFGSLVDICYDIRRTGQLDNIPNVTVPKPHSMVWGLG